MKTSIASMESAMTEQLKELIDKYSNTNTETAVLITQELRRLNAQRYLDKTLM